MIDNALDFLKNILTDVYKDRTAMKVDALQVYTLLVQQNTEIPVLTFLIPFSDHLLSIPAPYYNKSRAAFQAGQKINAVKLIRIHGWLDKNENDHPSLKEAKDFVEAYPGAVRT